ncbi:MASE1 domain-containing protein [Magnetospira sp. QH-2]|uniref:MASE1 domain-containing protein n=1 Tax=Magnetospira sp. (strain QH-2) TaxID=1288970 RepID=UPI00130ED8D8|nr:MASE1 domain-containing protein [Magnetospira sp. QH-2]
MATAYVVTARIGQTLAIPPGNVTAVWLPSGIMFAWAMIRGPRIWPGVFLGAFAGNAWAYLDMQSLATLLAALGSASANGLGDVLSTVGAAWAVRRLTGTTHPFGELSNLLHFFWIAVVFGQFISALFGVTGLAVAGFLPWENYAYTFVTWWTGDAVGVVVLAPLILSLAFPGEGANRWDNRGESLAAFSLLVLIAALAFGMREDNPFHGSFVFALIPVTLWAATRLQDWFAFFCVAVVAAFAIVATSLRTGPFFSDDINLALIQVQFFIGVMSLSVMTLAAGLAERNRARDQLAEARVDEEAHRQAVESENRFRRVMNSLDAVVYVADMETYELLFLNDSARRLFGDVERQTCWKVLQQGQTGPCDFCTNKYLLNADGTPAPTYVWEFQNTITGNWLDCRDRAIEWLDGRYVRMEVATDISQKKKTDQDLKESEEMLSMVLASTSDGIYAIDTDGICTLANPAAAHLLGYEGPEKLVGQSMHELIHHTNADGALMRKSDCHALRAVREGRSITIENEVFWKADGTPLRVRYAVQPIKKDDAIIGGVTSFTDITERIEAEKTVRQAQKMEAVGNLAGGIAHDVNNMLLPIIALTGLTLKQLPNDSRDKARLAKVIEAANIAKKLISQILAFSRRDDQESEFKVIAVNDLVRDTVKLLQSTLPSTVTVQADLDPDNSLIEADVSQLETVLINLATNAVDAIAGNVGEIRFNVNSMTMGPEHHSRTTDLSPGNYVRIAVSDNGCGMSEEILQRLFDPFFTTKAVGEGTGLGLSMAYGVIAKHGGAITVESEVGKGAIFDILIPRTTKTGE